ncbi:hypothetical protein C8R47DRAFT_1242257 [Mycena vitilis]|nr:hypothetical protein C8R47DRAFT_1242257 [Mycena vitilis]
MDPHSKPSTSFFTMLLRAEPARHKLYAYLSETGPVMCIVGNLVTELKPVAPKLAKWKSQRFQSYEFESASRAVVPYLLSGAVQVAESLPLVFIRLEETLEKNLLTSTIEALAQSINVVSEDRLRLSHAVESAAFFMGLTLFKLVETARFRQRIVSFMLGCRNVVEIGFYVCTYFPWSPPDNPMLRIALLAYILIISVDTSQRQANEALDGIILSAEWLAYEWSLMADQLKKPPEVDKEAEMARIFLGEKQGRVALGDLGSQMMLDFLWRYAKTGNLADLPSGDGLGSDGEPFLLPPLVHRHPAKVAVSPRSEDSKRPQASHAAAGCHLSQIVRAGPARLSYSTESLLGAIRKKRTTAQGKERLTPIGKSGYDLVESGTTFFQRFGLYEDQFNLRRSLHESLS